MFPFFTGLLTPARVNSYALGAFRAATGAAGVQWDLMHLLGYPFFLIFQGNDHGLGQFFGPWYSLSARCQCLPLGESNSAHRCHTLSGGVRT
jgi:hypothetical protein